jgi:hypothetical protein
MELFKSGSKCVPDKTISGLL